MYKRIFDIEKKLDEGMFQFEETKAFGGQHPWRARHTRDALPTCLAGGDRLSGRQGCTERHDSPSLDVGLANYLMGRHSLKRGTDDYGHAFEHFQLFPSPS